MVVKYLIRDYLDLTLVALAAVGLMKLELRPDGLALLRPPPDPFVFVLAADEAGEILLRFSLKLVLTVDDSRDAVDGVGGFRTIGPILEPLELLRLAGTRVIVRMGVDDDVELF